MLTGVLPYHVRDNYYKICEAIKRGVRPSRPTDPIQNQWLQEPVWDVIKTGWHHEPEQRCELRIVYHVFFTSGRQEIHVTGTGESNAQSNKVPDIETGQQQRGKILPRIASFLQSLRDSQSKVQRRVNEIDKVGTSSPNLSYPNANMNYST